MKEGLRVSEEMEVQRTFVPDVDADDAKASGMLGMISRVEAEESGQDKKTQPAMRTSRGASPFLLESLYFRSFGERGLLKKRPRSPSGWTMGPGAFGLPCVKPSGSCSNPNGHPFLQTALKCSKWSGD
jgi:hypothetical protein